jgi:coenzyme F420-dependent glucose-6-phosphate dehydrogenase
MTQFWFAASSEEFPPSRMLEQCVAAERAGFDVLGSSDHFAPWWPDGQASQAWVTLAAVGQRTSLPLATGVTPVIHHYHPAVVAQAFMSMEELYPGRVYLGVGSGEALNEVPLGLDWPEPAEMLERFEAGLEAITRLWAGETVTMDGGWFRLREAKLYTRAADRPRLYV